MMGGSMKLLDVRRDPRVALHSPTIEPPKHDMSTWPGDAKLAGRLVEPAPPAGDPDRGGGSFTLDISEVVLTYVGVSADHLVIESWHPGAGLATPDPHLTRPQPRRSGGRRAQPVDRSMQGLHRSPFQP
jgi:hypothetical protein